MDLIRGFDPGLTSLQQLNSCFPAVAFTGAKHISAQSTSKSRVSGMRFCHGAEVARKPNKQQVYL